MKTQLIRFLLPAIVIIDCSSCQSPKLQADAIFHHGVIYTVDSAFTVTESFAVKDGKILAVGKSNDILQKYEAKETVDLDGKAVYPGFIDAHCHFYRYALGLTDVRLEGASSFEEIIKKVTQEGKPNAAGWIIGRGWDQNLWPEKEFPSNEMLDSLFPSTPVLLHRVDGHAALVNSEALRRGGITEKTHPNGGVVEIKGGILTGILIDNAVGLVEQVIPPPTPEEQKSALLTAAKNCVAVGLTTVSDAGLDKADIDAIVKLQKEGDLKMRVYAMLNPSDENKKYYFKHGPYKTDRIHVCSFKIYADGALGSRGACLLQPYSDKPGYQGFLLHPAESYSAFAEEAYKYGFQMNTHCIGDSANRYLLHVYAKQLKGKNDRRWRIEHVSVVAPKDFALFGQYNIIPSIQFDFATSDMLWLNNRLGEERAQYAYAWKKLMAQNGLLAGGSDFPVEDINPLFSFYAGVSRKDKAGNPKGGFRPGEKMTRKEALMAMTSWAAYANFEEKEKGAIAPGYFADFVITDNDLMKAPEEILWKIKIVHTYIGGEKTF